jgi:hypothetical protein
VNFNQRAASAFSFHHEEREGHEEWTPDLENSSNVRAIVFFLRALRSPSWWYTPAGWEQSVWTVLQTHLPNLRGTAAPL